MNVNNLTYSANGLALTEKFEGLKLTAYQDVTGVWTNGYGNTHNVVPGSTITLGQAQTDLASNVEGAAYVVNTVVTVPLNQNQFDALVDFVFNLGSANLQSSTLLRLLNTGNYSGAANEFPKWNHAGGVVVQGLTNRRLAEQQLFNTPITTTPAQPSPTSSISLTDVANDVTSFFEGIQKDLGNT
jgi:lysozyme